MLKEIKRLTKTNIGDDVLVIWSDPKQACNEDIGASDLYTWANRGTLHSIDRKKKTIRLQTGYGHDDLDYGDGTIIHIGLIQTIFVCDKDHLNGTIRKALELHARKSE